MEMESKCINKMSNKCIVLFLLFLLIMVLMTLVIPQFAFADTLSNNYFNIDIGNNGEISSLQLTGDTYPTNYVMNASNSPSQDTPDHEWVGELMFKYRMGSGTWSTALTNQSGDVRTQSRDGNSVTVTYDNSANEQGIKNFKLSETYSLENDYLLWKIKVDNTSNQELEIGDFGLPLPFNEIWPSGKEIYETQVVFHSFVGNNNSYIYATRPSGIGNFLLMVPDAATGAGFEYMDHWRIQEHPGTKWAQDTGGWANGLNVYYIHSNVIKSTNRGYLPNTSLILEPGESKTYAFKFFSVANEDAMKDKLYSEGLIDVNVVPGMMFATNMTAKVDLHTSETINSVTAQYPDETTITYLNTVATDHKIYQISLSHLGQNDITVCYGNGEKTVLQFYATEPVDKALQRHAAFMVENTQWNDGSKPYNKIFDDWMMDTKSKRGEFNNYGGWGDDWGWTHAEFLAEKEALAPVPSEITAVDEYLETAVWNGIMKGNHTDYLVNDWFITDNTSSNNFGRGYAYPHIYNTYFSMYRTAKLHPDAIKYIHPRNTYLLRAYNIFKALYEGDVSYNWETGLMGEHTTPDLIQALKDEGYFKEANDIITKMETKYGNFQKVKYPYGSEYSYDNTGEEAVYTLADMNNNTTMMGLINAKTRACRGTQPLWYFYADPVTICGEAWWNFQYTTSLVGYCMDNWLKYHSDRPEIDERLSYAAKIANIGCINSGQIDPDPENIGAIAWTYQAEKGNIYQNSFDPANSTLHNGWRQMSGEADLGLFGAIRILSSDVSNDPIFGLFGYGCDVEKSGSDYIVIPKDGIFKRLNLITEKLYMELEQDEYTTATVSTAKDHIRFTLKNQEKAAHTTRVTFTGLMPHSYDVLINGTKVGYLNAVDGKKAVLNLSVGENETYDVELVKGDAPVNTAPVVNAGQDGIITLPDDIVLFGSVTDDGYPNSTITTSWSLQEGPDAGSASFSNASELGTTVTVSKEGTYVFKLTASDGDLSSSSTVKVTVNPAPPLPEKIVYYKFDETAGTTVSNSVYDGNDAVLGGSASWAVGKYGNSVCLDGNGAYVNLPSGIVNRVNDFTIAAWVKVNSIKTFARIFDFGAGTQKYMFLALGNGSKPLFAITENTNANEQKIVGPSAFPTGVWKHVAVTFSGTTGIMYIDGVEVARNANMTLSPSSLGATTKNYIGKSQFGGDPYLNGCIDDFIIYSRALSASEISELVGPIEAPTIQSIKEENIITQAGKAPVLPTVVSVVYSDGSTGTKSVTWALDGITPLMYEKAGNKFTVSGTVEGTGILAKANVTVAAAENNPYLVLRYKFDKEDKNTITDSSGKGNDGTLAGDPQWIIGHEGDALQFDGSTNYINAGTSTDLQPSNITVSYWIKRTGDMDSGEHIIFWAKPDMGWDSKGWFITYNGASNIFFVDGVSYFCVDQMPNDFLPLNEWTHIAATFNSDTKEAVIYKNGVAQNIKFDSSPDSLTATADTKYMGFTGPGWNASYLNAAIDDFRIYNAAMDASSIQSIYQSEIASINGVNLTTKAGIVPVLPSVVTAVYSDWTVEDVAVTWDLSTADFTKAGTVTVYGAVYGTSIPAIANVTVEEVETPLPTLTINYPSTGLTTSQSTIAVSGVISDPTLTVYIDVQSVADQTKYHTDEILPDKINQTTGAFSKEVNLFLGENSIVVGTSNKLVHSEEIIVTRSSGGSSGTTSKTASTDNKSTTLVTDDGKIVATPSLDLNSKHAIVTISSDDLNKAAAKTSADLDGMKTIIVKVGKVNGADGYVQELPVSALTAESSAQKIRIFTDIGTLTVPANMLTHTDAANAQKVALSVSIANASGLDASAKKQIGNRPVIELSLLVNGIMKAWNNPDAPVLINIPYTPDEAEKADPGHIVVWYIDSSGKAVAVPTGKYEPSTGMVTFKTTHFSRYAIAYVNKTFGDIGNYSWAKKEIEIMASKGVINGISDADFSPAESIRRADFILMLVKALGLTAKGDGNFSDVTSEAYYADAVAVAKKLGITKGSGDDKFNPDALISRQDMMTLINRALKVANKNLTEGKVSDLEGFEDKAAIAAYASDSIATLVKNGIVTGNGTKINPDGNATRAETAVLIYRIYNK